MKKEQDKDIVSQTNSVEVWWRHKLETRTTVPTCIEFPTHAREKGNDQLRLAWNQLAGHDYLELSYFAYCSKENLVALNEEEFHKAFIKLFTNKYSPPVLIKKCYGFRPYIDHEPVLRNEYMEVHHYFLSSIYFCRELFEMATGSEPIEWLDGRRMKESYKGSSAFWRELKQNRIYDDNYPQYGHGEFTPKYVDVVHGSRL
jgi:hypothetical protein